MCISDYRIGRHIRSVQTPYNTTGAAVTNIGSNPQRIGISFFAGAPISAVTSWVYIQSAAQGGTLASIAYLTLNIYKQEFDIRFHGDLVQRPWAVIPGNGNLAGTIIEYMLEESVLKSFLEEFKRQ